jgi:hypothetical protein
VTIFIQDGTEEKCHRRSYSAGRLSLYFFRCNARAFLLVSEKGKTFESLPPKRGEMQNKIVVCAMLNMDLQPDEKSSLRQYKLQITQALFQYPKEN